MFLELRRCRYNTRKKLRKKSAMTGHENSKNWHHGHIKNALFMHDTGSHHGVW